MVKEFICKNCLLFVSVITTPAKAKTRVFCSKSCLCTYYAQRMTLATKQKMRLAKLKPLVYKTCKNCPVIFTSKKKHRQFCSNRCSAIFRSKSPEYIKNLKAGIRKATLEGRRTSWSTRKKLHPSHPESVVIEMLTKMNVQYEREWKFNRWFVDFAFKDKRVAVEIDGKQHDYPERIESDKRKDMDLISIGWTVYRIRWKKISKSFYKELTDRLYEIFIRHEIAFNSLIITD
jgi:very-short-patch-repair endonuclease